ncbi:MAG: hypothetical protein IPN95_12705 [Bacteroidetes bacterium]|nr:hypothetical protein [Bacteroidota bacterium]
MIKKAALWFCFCSVFAVGGLAQSAAPKAPEPREFEMKDGDTTYTMRRYVMVLLYRGKKANKIPKDQLDKIQEGHMANISKLAAEGKLLVAGPMGDDTDLRGIFILDCESVEEAATLVDTDPAVMAGRLRAEYHTWWTARGTVIK